VAAGQGGHFLVPGRPLFDLAGQVSDAQPTTTDLKENICLNSPPSISLRQRGSPVCPPHQPVAPGTPRGGVAFPSTLPPILFLVVIFYLNFTSRVILSPLLPVLEPELGLGHEEAGALFLILQFGYCTGLLLSGFVACRLSHRGTILLSTVATGLILLALSRSTSLTGLRVGLWPLGTSAGPYLPAGIATITGMVSQEHWGKVLAVHELAPNLGYVTAPLLAEVLLRVVPWRGIFAVLGVLAVLMGGCFLLFGRGGAHRPEPPRFQAMGQLAEPVQGFPQDGERRSPVRPRAQSRFSLLPTA